MLAADLGSLISIEAAGTTGDEQMRLWINDVNVAQFDVTADGARDGQFGRYQFRSDTIVAADEVRIEFFNDRYRPAENYDRNLRIDFVEIDGVRFQSESPDVFGTGTWRSADGIVPGFRQSEYIHANGSFQYAGSATGAANVIDVFALGHEGEETMSLVIDGVTVSNWERVGGDRETRTFEQFRYVTDASVEATDVEVRFTNDRFIAGQLDRNLQIDRVEINGDVLQSEALTVFSRGNWQNGSIADGFRTSEILHGNGYLRFGVDGANPGTLSLATSNVSVDEDAGTATLTVRRGGGSDGIANVRYATVQASARSGKDFESTSGTLTFFDQQTEASIVIPILDDDLVEATESFNVTLDRPTIAPLLVPRTATVTILDDDGSLPNYDDFSDVNNLSLQGDASRAGNRLRLTAAEVDQIGSAYDRTAISLSDDQSFRSQFVFEITGGASGGEGLAFVLQSDAAAFEAIGTNPNLLGLAGIDPYVAVEFDTRQNGFDSNGNHVSILVGDARNPVATIPVALDLSGNRPIYAWVDYNAVSDVMAVYLSDTPSRSPFATLKTTIDLESILGASAFVGFTAANNADGHTHDLLSWSIDRQTPPADPPAEPVGDITTIEIASGLNRPTAIDWLPSGEMLVAQQNGMVRWIDLAGDVVADPVIDLSDRVNGTRDRGLLDIAVHPDFENSPYLYLLYTHDPPEVADYANGTLGGPDGRGNRAGQLMRVSIEFRDGALQAVPGTETILLGRNSVWENFEGTKNSTFDFDVDPAGELTDGSYLEDFIPSDSESHTVGSLAFAPDGSLFVSIGDGASYNRVDVRADRVQDIDSLSGKILRIDAETGRGLADNPFFNGEPDANRSKVYQSGLRNPFRISVDDTTGQLYIGDVGWGRWEEINSGPAGANFGWPFYEGGRGQSVVQTGYANTPEGEAFFAQSIAVTAPALALSHSADGINAIVAGDVYRGTRYGSEYSGGIFYNDLGQGIVRFATINGGELVDARQFTTGAGVVVAMREGPDGYLHYVDLDDGTVGRWEIV